MSHQQTEATSQVQAAATAAAQPAAQQTQPAAQQAQQAQQAAQQAQQAQQAAQQAIKISRKDFMNQLNPLSLEQHQSLLKIYTMSRQIDFARMVNDSIHMKFPSQWTEEDDIRLISCIKEYGKAWSIIATFFPGKSEVDLKNRAKKIHDDIKVAIN